LARFGAKVNRDIGKKTMQQHDSDQSATPEPPSIMSAIHNSSPGQTQKQGKDNDHAPLSDADSLAQIRKDLIRFAMLHLRNAELAEDIVQDTLMAAFMGKEQFEQRSSMKTWVFSILKNKIINSHRDLWNKRRIELSGSADDDNEFDFLYKANAHWNPSERPASWGNPEISLDNEQFWQVFHICMTDLSESSARVFSMREFLELEVEEICQELQITTSNCYQLLHRARMKLRFCLQKRWFEQEHPS
jgi:RNA polymerase sigma-70 factor (ECF subfamily)